MIGRLAGPFVFVVTLAVFAQTVGFDFLQSWDDGGMLLYNAHLTSWSPWWAFTSIYFGHWMPLTWLTWTVDAHLWGVWAGGWHAVNALIHAVNAVLVYVIAHRLVRHRGGAVVAALLFSIHPMRMESVAWITERKDVLSGLFVLLAVVAYLRYVDRYRNRWYWVALACGILGVMSKSIAVVLPAFLVLLDWGALHRWAWREKIPFVLVALAGTIEAFYAVVNGVHNMLPWYNAGLLPRLWHAGYSEVYYVWRTLWPSRLSHMIEYTWVPSWEQPQYPITAILCVSTVVFLATYRRRWLTAAIGAYAIAAFPQAGLFHNGPQLVANRYSYLAVIPLMLLCGALVALAARQSDAWRAVAFDGSAAALIALATVTTIALPNWKNDGALYTFAAESEPTCTACQDWAAVYAYKRGDLVGARRYFERAIPVSAVTNFPRYERHWGLGMVLDELGDREGAIQSLRRYLESVPPAYRKFPLDQAHMHDAEVRLARLEGRR